MFTTRAMGITGRGKTKWAADCDWTRQMDEARRGQEMLALVRFIRSGSEAMALAALSGRFTTAATRGAPPSLGGSGTAAQGVSDPCGMGDEWVNDGCGMLVRRRSFLA
jgi:hypothetical protein